MTNKICPKCNYKNEFENKLNGFYRTLNSVIYKVEKCIKCGFEILIEIVINVY